MCAIALMTGLYAVAVSPGSRINDIKLSGYYFYAESTDPVEENARKAADTFLASYINQYIADNGITREKVSPDALPGVSYITMDRAKGKRVFSYIEKCAVVEGAEAPSVPAVMPTPQLPEKEIKTTQTTTIVSTAPEKEFKDTNSESSTAPSTNAIAADVTDNRISLDPDAESDPATRVRKKILKNLLSTPDIEKAFGDLNRLKAEYVVKRLGPYAKCSNRMWAFWIVYDSTGKNLEALLSPGKEGERINLLTGDDSDSLDRYTSGQGKIAMFFEFR